MTHYYCPDCQLVLHEHELDTATEYVCSEYFGAITVTPSIYMICGSCGCEVEECMPCDRCRSALPMRGSDNCNACDLIIEAEEKALLGIVRPL